MPAVKLKTILTFFILHNKLNVTIIWNFLRFSCDNVDTLYVGRIMASVQTPQSSFSVYIKSHLKCSTEFINLCNRFHKINGKISFSPSKSNWKFHSFCISHFASRKIIIFRFQMNFGFQMKNCYMFSSFHSIVIIII